MSSGTSAGKRPERFHGAFTGGWSAGFYNSVGTAEGWTPSAFSSSRDKRAAPREQRPEDFMDDEDGLLTEQLQAKPAFDTLGSTAGEIAKQHAEREAAGGAIPGPAPSELIMPVGDPMGKKLLRTMGWREGQGVGSRVRRKRRRPAPGEGDESPEEDLPERALAGLGGRARDLIDKEGLTFAPKNADFKLQHVSAKTNLYGVGHKPFKDAPEFGNSRGAAGGAVGARGVYSTEDIVQHSNAAGASAETGLSRGPRVAAALHRGSHGFVLDDGEDDVYEAGFGKDAYDDALDEATHDNVAGAKAWALGGARPEDEPMLASRRYARCPSDGRLPPTGFVVAQRPDVEQKHWEPPIPPANFRPTFEFEHDVVAPLQVPNIQRRGSAGLDASGRARLLGEPSSRPVPSTPFAPPVMLDQGKARLPEGSSALSFLSPTARKQLLEAANGARAPSRFSPPSGAAAAEHPIRAGDARRQEGSNRPSEDLRFSLTSKFTSEKPPGALAGDALLQVVRGVDPASRPAGLSLRTPGTTDASKQSASLPALEETKGGAEVGQNPVRRTSDWAPAPLLCKRLNVPVPKASSAADWTMKGGGAAAPTDVVPASLSKFVPESSASSLPKVPLLKGMEQSHPVGAVRASVTTSDASAVAVAEDTPKERPPIDLFKSIFESESESDSDEDVESVGEGAPSAAGEAGSTPTAPPTEVRKAPESLFDKKSLHRGYGTDSSDESNGAESGQLGAAHRVDGYHSKKLEQGSRGESKRLRGESNSTSRKHGHKHKKHKKDKKDKKHRKHEKRKRTSKR